MKGRVYFNTDGAGLWSHRRARVLITDMSLADPDYPEFEVSVRGKIDGLLRYANMSHSVIDFKTCEINEITLAKYIRQLSCYAYALRYPNSSADYSVTVNEKIGLFVFQPSSFDMNVSGTANLSGDFKYIEYSWDEQDFVEFIKYKIIPLLAGKEPKPEENDSCWSYLKQFGFEYEEE